MSDHIAGFLNRSTPTAPPRGGRHRRRTRPSTSLSAAQQCAGLTVLLALADPVPTCTPHPIRPRARRAPIALTPPTAPILMDGADSRRYRLIRPSYQNWERQQPQHLGEWGELADLVRVAVSMGIGRW
ncbi:hypothetical protein GCM10027590_21310 [Nocardiopsis nanhaiensis]